METSYKPTYPILISLAYRYIESTHTFFILFSIDGELARKQSTHVADIAEQPSHLFIIIIIIFGGFKFQHRKWQCRPEHCHLLQCSLLFHNHS